MYFWNVINRCELSEIITIRLYSGRWAWKQANKAVESQLPVYITQAISRLSNVCYMRVRVSKRGQLAYTE